MSEHTCGTCKYRGEAIEGRLNEDYDYGPTSYFLCERIKHINKSPVRQEPREYPPGLKAGAMDGSGYHAALCVETDFGCNLWEPKE